MDDKIEYIQTIYKRKFNKLIPSNIDNMYKMNDDYFIILRHGENFILDGVFITNLDEYPKYEDEMIIIYDLSRKYIK